MSELYWIGIALVAVGVAIRLGVWRRYLDLHAKRYGGAPPRGWLWTSVDDPEVERWRRYMAAGSLIGFAGAGIALLGVLR